MRVIRYAAICKNTDPGRPRTRGKPRQIQQRAFTAWWGTSVTPGARRRGWPTGTRRENSVPARGLNSRRRRHRADRHQQAAGQPLGIRGCGAVAYEQTGHAARLLDDDEKGIHIVDTLDDDEKGFSSVDAPGGQQEMTVVSEPGLCRLDEDEKDVANTDTPGGVQEMLIVGRLIRGADFGLKAANLRLSPPWVPARRGSRRTSKTGTSCTCFFGRLRHQQQFGTTSSTSHAVDRQRPCNVHRLAASGDLPRGAASVVVAIGGSTQTLRIAHVPCVLGSDFALWRCECGQRRRHLYFVKGRFVCRGCGNVAYASRHVNWGPAFRQVTELRKRLGADPRPFTPLPPRPKRYPQHARYDRLVARIAAAEALALSTLGKLTLAADVRRKGKL